MKGLRDVNITSIAFIGILFCAGIVEADLINKIKSTIYSALNIEPDNKFMKIYSNGCECVQYDCGCCLHLKWAVFMEGKLCINASYLEEDYGISLAVTYNDFSIVNETISALNPPPICFGQNITNAIGVCLRIYDIAIHSHMFHACFEISGKIMRLTINKINLGCIRSNLRNKIEYIKITNQVYKNNQPSDLSPLLLKTMVNDTLPSVIMNTSVRNTPYMFNVPFLCFFYIMTKTLMWQR